MSLIFERMSLRLQIFQPTNQGPVSTKQENVHKRSESTSNILGVCLHTPQSHINVLK